MKGIDRATIHRHNRENYTGLLHILKSKQIFLGFLSFANFLVMQIFINFLDFVNFYFVSCKVMKAVKIEFDTSYLSWGSSPKLASDLLLLVVIKPNCSKPSTPPVATTITAPCLDPLLTQIWPTHKC